MFRVLLINMPFSTTKWPSLGISMLKPQLVKQGYHCDIRYFNLDFASIVGVDLYEKVSLYSPNLLGERIFAKELFGDRLPGDSEYIATCGLTSIRNESFLAEALQISDLIADYLDGCADLIHEVGYDCIGFTNMFEQTLASVSLAERIKQRNPHVKIVMGGANCDGEMGIGLMINFTCLDAICRGEADESFVDLINTFNANSPIGTIPGVVHRDSSGKVVSNDCIAIIENLDILPFPDYDDYFTQIQNYSCLKGTCTEIHLQCSRGCWWGDKVPCKFCGLNRNTIKYRSKSGNRVLEELHYVNINYIKPQALNMVSMTDNILDMNYFDEVIPKLIENQQKFNIFFEVKSSLSNYQLHQLKSAGIKWVQPGIENLSTGVLQMMSKGVTGINNIRFLKQCMKEGIYATWNLIFGFPYEKEEHYTKLFQTIPKIIHLIPPEGFTPLALQRFSVYANNPGKYGITNVRPESSYQFIFPFDANAISQIAYFFDYEYTEDAVPFNGVPVLSEYVNYWTESYNKGQRLTYHTIGVNKIVLEDSRDSAVSQHLILENYEMDIYEYCYDVRHIDSIMKYLNELEINDNFQKSNIINFLDELVTRNVMLKEGDKYLALAIPTG